MRQADRKRSAGCEAAVAVGAKARLTAGADMWTTHPEPRLGIRAVRFSDAFAGVRGPSFDERATAWCAPCGAALAASCDVSLAQELGDFIAHEAIRRSVDVVLGPVLNIPRSPLAGRNFECLSEDPLLSGLMAVGWISGVQGYGVSAYPKHFVGNDAETSRTRGRLRHRRARLARDLSRAVRDHHEGASVDRHDGVQPRERNVRVRALWACARSPQTPVGQ